VGEEKESNRRRTDIPSSYNDVSFEAIADLPVPAGPKARSKWPEDLLAEFEAFEGIPVRVVGFLVAVKPQSGECRSDELSLHESGGNRLALGAGRQRGGR